MKRIVYFYPAIIFLLCAQPAIAQKKTSGQPPMKLWYRQPAHAFEEALVLGNGKMGATVYGGSDTDLIHLNDITLWSGEPVDPYLNKEAYKNLPAVREALEQNNYAAADTLIKKLQGKFSESYAPLGNLYLDFHTPQVKNYYRDLDLDRAMVSVQYETGDTKIRREYFVSYPDKVFVIHVTASKAKALDFSIRFDSKLQYKAIKTSAGLHFRGSAPVRAEPNYVRKKGNPILFMENRGTRFSADIMTKLVDGKIEKTESTIHISGATEVTILVSLATSFNGFDKNPVSQGLPDETIAANQLKAIAGKRYPQLVSDHLRDYRKYYQRVTLSLGGTDGTDLPTDDRLRRYSKGETDRYLETLYFQFGRYLLISSSRTPGVPANLQGLWNPHMQPPWSSNYTMNINAEENYWLAENTNLSEMHLPFLSFLGNLEKTGRITAKTFYNAPGWVCHHNSDIWAMTNPVGDFGNGDPEWANWNMGGVWASAHLWEHYLFTQDKKFLAEKAYPLLKGAAEFCLFMLVKDEKGDYITSPSTSPENIYLNDKGFKGAVLYGGTADLAMIRELFLDVVASQKTLGVDVVFRKQLEETIAKLHPYQVGKLGNLQEWYYDWQDADPKHRHQSHLYGLYPGTHITTEATPALANAARRTLEIKGDETTGWSKGWRINLWARLKDGDHAYKMYRELLKYVEPDNVKVAYRRGGGTYPNLFDAHPPFQIDGNFGGAAAVAEMLLQSSSEKIEILPALPAAWQTGSVKGLKARGGLEVAIEWADGKLKQLTVKGKPAASFRWIYAGKEMKAKLNESGSFVYQ
ncbi:MAG: glycoside hydrolase family 95 protein [Bacteroidota bacterium]